MIAIGTDIVEIGRIEKVLDRQNDKFAKRVLTDFEQTEFASHSQPARYLAKKFAVKEAASKALGTGIGRGVSFQHFEVTHDDFGKPILQFTSEAKRLADEMGVKTILVSIADEQEYAVGFVTLS